MARMFACALLFSAMVFAAWAATFLEDGPCPEGVKVGEKWMYGECQQCTCGDGEHFCESCGVMVMEGCELKFNKSLIYPTCCEPIKTICKNDPELISEHTEELEPGYEETEP